MATSIFYFAQNHLHVHIFLHHKTMIPVFHISLQVQLTLNFKRHLIWSPPPHLKSSRFYFVSPVLHSRYSHSYPVYKLFLFTANPDLLSAMYKI